jgi:hypothetical protein
VDQLVDANGVVRFSGEFGGAAAVAQWLTGDAGYWNDDNPEGGTYLWAGGLVPIWAVTLSGDGGARGWSVFDRRLSSSYDAIPPELMLEVFAYFIEHGAYESGAGPPFWTLTVANSAALRAALPALGAGDGTRDPYA